MVLAVVLCALAAPIIAGDPLLVDMAQRFAGPSLNHPFGTDQFGRDIWSRVVFGARRSLLIAIMVVLLSSIVGITIGCLAAERRGWIDNLLMRLVDILLAFPPILLAFIVGFTFGFNTFSLIVAISAADIPLFARTARSSAFQVKENLYIDAEIAIGASPVFILFNHILPNIASPILVIASMLFGEAIIIESSLSFLSIGGSPLSPSLGAMLASGKPFLSDYPHIVLFPALMIAIPVLGAYLLADGLQNR